MWNPHKLLEMSGVSRLREEVVEEFENLFREDRAHAQIYAICFELGDRFLIGEAVAAAEKELGRRGVHELVAEALCSMVWWRLLAPASHGHRLGLDWRLDSVLLRYEEVFEVPNAVRFTYQSLLEGLGWSWREGVLRYLCAIKDPFAEMGVEAVSKLLSKGVFGLYVSAKSIKEACLEAEYPRDPGAFIAELKGGGVLSPRVDLSHNAIFLREALEKGLGRGPFYELNRGLFVKEIRVKS